MARSLRKVALIALSAAALLVAIVLGGGALMPRTHTAQSTIVISQPVDSVWSIVRDFQAMADWWGNLERIEPGEGPGERWVQYSNTGSFTLVVTESLPPERLVTRVDVEESAPFGGTWTYELEPSGSGTRITITEDGFINNLFFRFMANTVFGVHSTMDSYLRALASRFGEEGQPTHVE